MQLEVPDLVRHDLGGLIRREVASEEHLPELACEQAMRAFELRVVCRQRPQDQLSPDRGIPNCVRRSR